MHKLMKPQKWANCVFFLDHTKYCYVTYSLFLLTSSMQRKYSQVIAYHANMLSQLSSVSPPLSAAQLCSQALEMVTASRAVRGEIRSLVVSVQARKTQARERITTAVAKNMEEAKAHKVGPKPRSHQILSLVVRRGSLGSWSQLSYF